MQNFFVKHVTTALGADVKQTHELMWQCIKKPSFLLCVNRMNCSLS